MHSYSLIKSLEYYKGIMFLTTDRVQTFDDAINAEYY